MKEIITFLTNPEVYGFYRISKFIFIGVSLYLLAWIFFFLIKNSWLKNVCFEDLTEAFTYKPFGRKKINKRWDRIVKRLDIEKESEFKLALIDADDLLGEIFEKMGYKGTMTDILKQLNTGIVSNLEDIEKVHQIRNKVVRDPDYKLSREEAERILGIYKEALRGLEAF